MLVKNFSRVSHDEIVRWGIVALVAVTLAAIIVGVFTMNFDVLSIARSSGVHVPSWIINTISVTSSAHALVDLIALAVGVTMPVAWAAAVSGAGAVAF